MLQRNCTSSSTTSNNYSNISSTTVVIAGSGIVVVAVVNTVLPLDVLVCGPGEHYVQVIQIISEVQYSPWCVVGYGCPREGVQCAYA